MCCLMLVACKRLALTQSGLTWECQALPRMFGAIVGRLSARISAHTLVGRHEFTTRFESCRHILNADIRATRLHPPSESSSHVRFNPSNAESSRFPTSIAAQVDCRRGRYHGPLGSRKYLCSRQVPPHRGHRHLVGFSIRRLTGGAEPTASTTGGGYMARLLPRQANADD